MTLPAIRIERATRSSLRQILPLIKQYQEFYRVSPNKSKNERFFRRLLLNQKIGVLFMAMDAQGAAAGFATLYFLPSSLSAQTACVLNDLYTMRARRGKGIARALLNHCEEYALKKGFEKIEWQTEASNKTAQRLYDKTPALKTTWRHYSMTLK